MIPCCLEFTPLGCFTHCDLITTDIRSEFDDGSVFTVCYYLRNAVSCHGFTVDNGDFIAFQHFGSYYGEHRIFVTDPDGNEVGCFTFSTQIQFNFIDG